MALKKGVWWPDAVYWKGKMRPRQRRRPRCQPRSAPPGLPEICSFLLLLVARAHRVNNSEKNEHTTVSTEYESQR